MIKNAKFIKRTHTPEDNALSVEEQERDMATTYEGQNNKGATYELRKNK